MPVLERSQFIPVPLDEVFRFFSEARNLETLTPAWLGFRFLTPGPIEMGAGARIEYRISLHGVPVRWRTLIAEWDPPHAFKDIQLKGPYKLWEHEHRFEAVAGGTLMKDIFHYELPFGWLGRLVERFWVRREVKRIFDYRAERIAALWGRTA
jgi:ligand-binding SRPBCC domain-containing protein